MAKRRPLLGTNSGILGDVPIFALTTPPPQINPNLTSSSSSLLGDGPQEKQPKLQNSSSSLLGDSPTSLKFRKSAAPLNQR